MDPVAAAVLASWNFPLPVVLLLAACAVVYLRGAGKLHYAGWRLAAFLAGLGTILLAIASPLDAFSGFLLQVHMIQHLSLMMVAPPLIWMGQPVLAMIRGLPAALVRDTLSPFLTSPPLKRTGRLLTHPVTGWLAMAAATVIWHLPRFYELALHSSTWHQAEHICFLTAALLFWWPVIEVWPSRRQWPRWAMFPYLLTADFINTALSAWLTFSSHVVYPTYALAPRLFGISALNDQSTAGVIMWVPGSILYLVPAFIVIMQALSGSRQRVPAAVFPILQHRPRDWFAPILRLRHFRTVLQTLMLVLAAAVAADGFLGRQVAPLNLAGTLPWTYWRGFAVIALLGAGNLFCMACPFTLPRDVARRWIRPRFRWPQQLRSKWLAAGLLVTYLWSYENFSLWNSPWLTAWIIVGYFATALIVDSFFQGASFCKYVCPIGQFHFVHSLVSPLEVKIRETAPCVSCQTHDCLNGNARQRGCEMQLFQPRKTGNFDCTFCLDCVHACPQDNVGIGLVVPGVSLRAERPLRPDLAALMVLLAFGAFVNAAGMVFPVSPIAYAVLLVLPLAMVVSTEGRKYAPALVPLGFSMWIAHFLFHLVTGWKSLLPALRLAITTGNPIAAAWLTPAQILLLDAGLLLSLYVAWRISRRHLGGIAPWAVLLCLLYSAGVWILFQPMQMRGMVMN